MTEKTKEAQEQIQQVYEDKAATLPSGKTYVITKMTHISRRTVFAFFTHIQDDLRRGDLWFLTSPEWEKVEAILFNAITVDDSLISKKPDHWEEYPEDYILFIQTMLPAVSYPFMRGVIGG
jgi:hypothetical protein